MRANAAYTLGQMDICMFKNCFTNVYYFVRASFKWAPTCFRRLGEMGAAALKTNTHILTACKQQFPKQPNNNASRVARNRPDICARPRCMPLMRPRAQVNETFYIREACQSGYITCCSQLPHRRAMQMQNETKRVHKNFFPSMLGKAVLVVNNYICATQPRYNMKPKS
mgnify:CR=1 FL=1